MVEYLSIIVDGKDVIGFSLIPGKLPICIQKIAHFEYDQMQIFLNHEIGHK